ncbi:MAG: choice-of-anchor L domain-containing protein [Bryobacteraceae bacterium]|nr:choice-of-anchor L domain-containing protein [Bryobacteraceae bacterium]
MLVRTFFFLVTLTCLAGASVIVTPTTDTAALASGLGGGGGLTINSVFIVQGNEVQFGTYTNFITGPVRIGNGIVLSTGLVSEVVPGSLADTDLLGEGSAEFDAYGPGRIENFEESYDVASLLVNFSLVSPSQVGFDFVFGSIEYPDFTSLYTDAFLAFLNGTTPANQIVFDSLGNPVQVGISFANLLTTADTNTVFADPYGLVRLQTFTTGQLPAGEHSLLFTVGDVNDGILDSAVFISNLRAGVGQSGGTTSPVPEPGTLALMGGAAGALLLRRWLRRDSRRSL